MPVDVNELLEEIEEYRGLAERFRQEAPSVWGVQLRLFGEKVTDLIGLAHDLDADAFDDRDEFLKHLRSIDAIDESQYRHLDKIRWVGNQLAHGKQKSLSPASMLQAWESFESLNQSRFWLRTAKQPDIDVERLIEAVGGFINGSGKVAKAAGKVAVRGAGLAVAGALLYSWIKHTSSPEHKAQQERERQFNAKIIKGALIGLGVIVVASLVSTLFK
jgi:hypothetical protein